MSHSDNLGSFFKESKPLLKEYVDTRFDLFRLQAVRIVSKSAGYLVWVLISLFLFFIIMIFTGIVIGCWFSGILNSYVLGFGLTTLIMVLIFALLAVFRNALFIQALMQGIIKKALEEYEEDKADIND